MHRSDSLNPRQIERGLRLNILAGSLGIAWMAMTVSLPLTLFLESLGATGAQIGLSVSLQQIAMGIQIPSALLVERLSRRKVYWAVGAIPHRMMWFLPAVLLLWPGISSAMVIQLTLWMVAVSSLLAHASAPAWFSWMADLVPPEKGGRFWGVRQSCTTAVFVLAMIGSGRYLQQIQGTSGFVPLFAAGALMGTLDVLIHLRVPEPVSIRTESRTPLRSRLRSILILPDFRWLTLAFGFWAFSASLHASFTPVYLKREFGLEYRHLVLLPIAGALSGILSGIPVGRLIDRWGARTVGLFLMALGPGLGFFWFLLFPGEWMLVGITLPRSLWMLLLSHLLAGGMYAGLGLCQIHLLNTVTPKEGRALAMALHWSTIGGMAALGAWGGGWFMDLWQEKAWQIESPIGASFTFFQCLVIVHVTLAWFVGIPLLRRVKNRAGNLSSRMVLAALRIGNPFRPMFPLSAGYLNTQQRNRKSRDK